MKTELLNNYVTHRHGGNGYVVLQEQHEHPDYCRVGYIHNETDHKTKSDKWVVVRNQAMLAHKELLKVEMTKDEKDNPIPLAIQQNAMPTVRAIRAGLESGDLAVVMTHIIPR
jgi:hypothetical protein